MQDRMVVIVSGNICTGKSHTLKRLLAFPKLAEAQSFHLDPLRISLWGNRGDTHITKTEHVFKNEHMRHEMLKALILGTPIVASEIVMLTREHHQKPMMEMVRRAEQYLQTIEQESCNRDSLPAPVQSVRVRLKVILCYASLEAIERRLSGDMVERRESQSCALDWASMFNGYNQFEFPDHTTYEPLYLDTSDESTAANVVRFAEVGSFLNNQFDPKEVNVSRRAQAEEYQRQILARIKTEMGA